jgi:hypothetical protein
MALGMLSFGKRASNRGRSLPAIVVAAALAVLLSPPAIAQSGNPADGATPSANLTIEQRHMIKELVKELKVPPVTVETPSAIGDTVPESVVAQPIPVEVSQRVPQIRSHAFFVKDRRIVLVNPKDRKITDVID